ncbi:site-specific DNA-methyltransferase [Winogradskyella marincola]|uniref:site-specific DNA-methyltransferase (adenine-specific) n=1 Tax=Winogradskyella marincola TaxID=3037795 RepID=A0ABT6FYG4_9FLAO|nr:site-specific DNA-methyltransferase [Winogradskyella sp. YYF002]MDG4714833.1 site-specific DNA-methyltransferase [Winogradskyella sp. YYF002]
MAKKYKGSLTLDWFNKQKAIVNLDESSIKSESDIPAPLINWINKDEALFYDLNKDDGKGNTPYWVNRDDIRVKEARPLVFQKGFKAVEQEKGFSIKEVEKEEDVLDTDNMLIKGDNLLVLNTLKKHFDKLPDNEKIKCIFIDPPYNTGSAFEQYDDNLMHSEWLTLMRDRLNVLKQLLSEDGSIWITIDDDESHYLKVLCDDVFGRDNFVSNIIWQKKFSPQNDAKWFSDMHDHILVYAKDKENWRPNLLPRTDEMDSRYKNLDDDPRGKWTSGDLLRKDVQKSGVYTITTPSGRVCNPPAGTSWRVPEYKYKELLDDNRLWFGKNGDGVPRLKRFLKDVKSGITPLTIWLYGEVGHNQDAKKEVKELNEDDVFDTPKPEKLMQRIIHLATNEGDLVFDCFGGSGTTFAVAHKMNRKWIGVEIGNHADTHIISRMKGVINGTDKIGITESVNWQGGGSFKYYHLGESIINVDKETGKGEFNWQLGKQFIQESLLLSYDFVVQDINVFPAQIFPDKQNQPTVGKLIGSSGKSVYGIATLMSPNDKEAVISNEDVKTIYNTLKNQEDFQSLVIYTNKGIDLAQDTIPEDLDIIKVPNAIFSELER